MSDSDKTSWWNMHEKSAKKFDSRNGKFFPSTVILVIFYIESNRIIVHTDNTMITDSNSVCILSEIIDYRLGSIKGFLTMRNPFFRITGIKKFLESIAITIFFTASMKS